MQDIYPPGPASFPASLTQAAPSYKRQAWLAMLALLGFVGFYLALSGWFAWKGYKLIYAGVYGSSTQGVWLFLAGVASALLAVFMLKALVFIRRGDLGGLKEITAAEQPALFAFLYRLADEAGAPRPRKVFVSARVNAAVFYDLSPLNLLFPSKKNLEIGLALVNVLSLSELKAVLAHEFGHFAQRSMAVGRWVYVSQQIAGHIVSKRDGLDSFLRALSRFDVRIAWVGWVLSLVIWSIRSVVDTFFRLVLLADRALSREMEFQADRVSVCLAGSDALIHALYRCRAADQAWDRALAFANEELARGFATADLFEIQSLIISRLESILDDPAFAAPPARTSAEPSEHRVFKREMVTPSRMWSTHPFNHEREDNAKKIYLGVPLDDRPAWALLRDAEGLRQAVSASLCSHVSPQPAVATREQSLAALEAAYGRESYKALYRGVYLSRQLTRRYGSVEALFDARPDAAATAPYPASLSDALKQLETLLGEKSRLNAVIEGAAQAAPNGLEHRGKQLQRKELPGALQAVEREISAVEDELAAHDRLCRSQARAWALAQGNGWDAYWSGLLALLHYSEHVQADIVDAHGSLANIVAMLTAGRKVNDKGLARILDSAAQLYLLLSQVNNSREKLVPDAGTLALLGQPGWSKVLGEWGLNAPGPDNLASWLNVIDGWNGQVVGALSRLRRAALDQLLVTEARLAEAAARGESLPAAPAAAQVPLDYRTFLSGDERPRQKKLDWWSRFQTADGWIPGTVRFAAAGGIIVGLMGLDGSFGNASVTVFNGLDRAVVAQLGGERVNLQPGQKSRRSVPADQPLAISAKTAEGTTIESFEAKADAIGTEYVYNVASASPLLEWTASYGSAAQIPERPLGAPRWLQTRVDAILEKPPEQISTKGQGGTRSVLSSAPTRSTRENLGLTTDPEARKTVILMHARWDAAGSPGVLDWLGLASMYPEAAEIFRQRLAADPLDMAVLRVEQDLPAAGKPDAVCDRDRQLAARHPANTDLKYLVVRCMPDGPPRDAAFVAGHRESPANPWFGYASGFSLAATGQWPAAERAFGAALKFAPLADRTALELARVRRLQAGEKAGLDDLAPRSEQLRMILALDKPNGAKLQGQDLFYSELARGHIDVARSAMGSAGPGYSRMLRFMAASDGAPDDLVQRSLALPVTEGIDQESLWSAVGLAIRHKRKTEDLLQVVRQLPSEQGAAMLRFIDALENGRDVKKAEEAMQYAWPGLKGQAYVMGTVVMGKAAPANWRDYAKRALFTTERPYLL
ncbi:M48 family metallopeptidase [Polaromonas sp. LjRoot131]|uniref:M48 family metallopeptidase n=1 Tax=Polaromonas sp. LjRoot131 TaxID=3342262 RepID=UPI003ECCD30A